MTVRLLRASATENDMPGTCCINCRWWNGRKDWAQEAMFEKDRHGKCERHHASAALRDDSAARLYPVGTCAWLDTRFDFSCAQWEKDAALRGGQRE